MVQGHPKCSLYVCMYVYIYMHMCVVQDLFEGWFEGLTSDLNKVCRFSLFRGVPRI